MTHSDLSSYKLYTRCYAGKLDTNLSKTRHVNVVTDQKWINLYVIMLKPFNGNGHYVTCDSACMGDIIAQVSRNEWKINMVGTIRLDLTGTDITTTCDEMAKRMYETAVWQHNTLPLCVAAWADNAVVKTLSNFHSSVVINKGIKRRGLDEDGMRMKDPAPVNCLDQMAVIVKRSI